MRLFNIILIIVILKFNVYTLVNIGKLSLQSNNCTTESERLKPRFLRIKIIRI